MNKNKNYFTRGLWVFAFLTVCMLASLFAAQTDYPVLMYAGVIISIVVSLGFLMVILQSSKMIVHLEEEVQRLREREEAHVQKHQHAAEDKTQKTEVFKVDEAFARIMQVAGMQTNTVEAYSETILQNIAKELKIVQGLIFVLKDADEMFHHSGQYAYYSVEKPRSFPLGENLSGQVAKYKEMLNLKQVPDNYITVLSGLGKSTPHHLVIAPIIHNDKSIGVMEIASFKPFGENEETLVSKICEAMANRFNELREVKYEQSQNIK